MLRLLHMLPSCETFFHKADHFNRQFLCCEGRFKNLYPRNVSTLKETFFEKTDEFKIESTREQTLFKHVSLFLYLNQYALRVKEEKNNRNTHFDQEDWTQFGVTFNQFTRKTQSFVWQRSTVHYLGLLKEKKRIRSKKFYNENNIKSS